MVFSFRTCALSRFTFNMATMATNMVDVSTAENTVVTGNANLDAGIQVVREEKEKQDQLYADFPSDALPVSSQNQPAETSGTGAYTNANQTKRVDPRQDWINTDKTKPYYCKLCDYNMDCMEVGAFFNSKIEIKLRQPLCSSIQCRIYLFIYLFIY